MGRFPLKLITFDVNGTLLKPKGAIGQTYSRFARRRGLSVDPEALDGGFRTAYKTMTRDHPNFGRASGLGWKSWWRNVVRETFESAVSPSNGRAARIETITVDLINHFSTGESWELEKDALRVLDRLKGNSVGMGVVSNTDPRLHKVVKDIGLANYFVFVLTSYEANVAKPDVGIFHAALETYRRISGAEIDTSCVLHVGNSYNLDYLGATNAGWQCVLVNFKDGLACRECLAFENLKDFDDHLVELGCK